MHVYVYIYIYMCLIIYACTYIHICIMCSVYIHTNMHVFDLLWPVISRVTLVDIAVERVTHTPINTTEGWGVCFLYMSKEAGGFQIWRVSEKYSHFFKYGYNITAESCMGNWQRGWFGNMWNETGGNCTGCFQIKLALWIATQRVTLVEIWEFLWLGLKETSRTPCFVLFRYCRKHQTVYKSRLAV